MASYSKKSFEAPIFNSFIFKLLNKYRIVAREILWLETPTPNPKESGYVHCGLFFKYALGEPIAFAVYNKSSNTIVRIESYSVLETSILVSIFSSLLKTSSTDEKYATILESVIKESLSNNNNVLFKPIPMYKLVLKLRLKYVPYLAGKIEQPNTVQIYLSNTYESEGSKVPCLRPDDLKFLSEGEFDFMVNRNYVPGNARLNVDTYALLMNSEGEYCENQSGYTNIPLSTIVENMNKQFILPLYVPNMDERVKKGEIYITCLDCNLPLKQYSKKERVGANMSDTTAVDQYIRHNQLFYNENPPVSASINNITVFTYQCRTGFCPGSMFDKFKIPKSNEEYYLNALHIAMCRRFPHFNDKTIMAFDGLDQNTQLVIALDMIRLFSNYCFYITDKTVIRTNSRIEDKIFESFDNIRNRYAADCEDFMKEMLIEAHEIAYNDFVTSSMQIVKRLFDNFIFTSILCGASKSSLSWKETRGGGASMMGHECGAVIPKHMFFDMLRRSTPDHPVFSLLDPSELTKGVGQKMYMLEGTGNMFPEERTPSEWYVKSLSAFSQHIPAQLDAVMKKQHFYSSDDERNNFYKIMITILTPSIFFMTGVRQFEFLLCKDGRRGVSLQDFIKNTDRVCIKPSPEIPLLTYRVASRFDADTLPLEPLEYSDTKSPHCGTKIQAFIGAHDVSTVPSDLTPDNSILFQLREEDLFIDADGKQIDSLAVIKYACERSGLTMTCTREVVKQRSSDGRSLVGINFILYSKRV